ncbi:MAG TPA: ABC transporter permease [Polyangiaceae bacterium]|nr:ABC transporter permease [Polyangiaceae bacterium]
MSLGPSWQKWLWRSPLVVRELRQAVRTGRTIVVLLILAVLVGLLVVAIAGAFGMGKSPVNLGPVLFQVFFSLAFFIVLVVGPTMAAVGVASEKDGRTWEALILAGMDGRAVARGKFWTAATAIIAFLCMIAPASLLCILLGGVTVIELGVAFVLLTLIAMVAVAFGVAVGAWAGSTGSATLTALGAALLGAPAFYFGVGLGISFLAHATWPEIPSALPVWLPLAYTRAPFDALYVLLLVVLPLTLTSLALWFFYELAVLLLAPRSDDRATGIKRWYLVSLPIVGMMGFIPGLMTRGVGSTTAWIAGLSGLFLFVIFAAFVLAGDALAPSPRVEFRWHRDGATWLTRVLGPGLVQTCTLQLVTALTALSAFALGGAAILSKGVFPGLPPVPAVSLLICAENWSAFLLFVVGFLLWSRVRSESAGAARLLTAMVATVAVAAPWALFVVFAYPATKRGLDAMVFAAPSPLYSLAMVRAVEKGEPHLPVTAGLGCSLGWAALGLTLFAFGARRATKAIAARRTSEADLAARIAEELPSMPPVAPSGAGPPETLYDVGEGLR